MFKPIEPSADQPSGGRRRRPSLGRIFFWSIAIGLPVVAVGGGVALFIASNQLDAAVEAYRNAGPCPGTVTTTACYTTAPGTLIKFSTSHGKTGDTTDMTLQLPDRTWSTWAKTSWQQQDALHVGAPVQATFYKGALTAVYVSGVGIQTKDNPIYKQSDLRLGAVVIPILGVLVAAVAVFPLRGGRQSRANPVLAIDPTRPIEQQEALLRRALLNESPAGAPREGAGTQAAGVTLPFVLRPHPIPTGRPWWVGLVVAAIGMPLLLLRMRTPGAIAEVVLGLMVITMLAAVLLHWLYRNRRQLVVDDLSVRRVNMFGAVRVVSRGDVARVVCPIVMNFGAATPEPRLLLLDAGGRSLLGLERYYPLDEEVSQLASALRVPLDKTLGPVTTPARLRREIPGSISWSEAHPFVVSFLLIPPILAAIVLFIWVLNGFKWTS